MTRNPISAALAAALLGSLALAGCKKDEPAPPAVTAPATTPAPTPAAMPTPARTVSVTSVELGTAVDGSNRVTSPATTFATTDTIYASAATSSADPSTPQTGQLTARWSYEGDQLVEETSRDFSFTGSGTTAFEVSKPDGWPTGNYRVEILHDGEVVQTRDFVIR